MWRTPFFIVCVSVTQKLFAHWLNFIQYSAYHGFTEGVMVNPLKPKFYQSFSSPMKYGMVRIVARQWADKELQFYSQ